MSHSMLAVNTLRTLSIDLVQAANSGHPGLPLGAAPMAYALWQDHLKFDPKQPKWADRDRFVLSAGHGSALLYSLLHCYGYALPIEELKRFRQWGSKTPGHPEYGHTPGVEATTGPLGQGAANAVGMAIAERRLAATFNRPGFELVNHYTYALVSDGDLMEGVSAEAASLAGHLKLGKLIYLYDANDVTLDGPASLCFSTENVAKRYEAYGWQVLVVEKGDTDLSGISAAITKAKADTARPTLILIQTTIGYGSPNKQGKCSSHGSPLGLEELALTKKALGWKETQPFTVPEEARAHFEESIARGKVAAEAWAKLFQSYRTRFPAEADEWERFQSGGLPDLSKFHLEWKTGEKIATRESAGKVLNALAQKLPELFGGDADLGGSTFTVLKGLGSFSGQTGEGRNIHYGVREHAMASIANGIAFHGGLRSFTATFFCFADYMRPTLRIAAMNHLPVIHVWTHDSIGLGEDGPTHQPVEHLASLRCIPGLVVLRPCDAAEAEEAWKHAIERKTGPTGLVLSRQKLPNLDRSAEAGISTAVGLHKGAYTLAEASTGTPKLILIATGSEIALALESKQELERKGIPTRVVSMPSFELFRSQPQSYRDAVLPKAVRARVAIEAGSSFGWKEWIGDAGTSVTVDRFGASAPDAKLLEEYGLTKSGVLEAVERSIALSKL